MRIFLIDFENVHNDGLMGMDMLTDDDEVVIFYSANADSISFEILHKFMFCKAKLNYFKVRRGGKNALDFQLSTFLGYKLHISPEAEFYIISRDSGFDFVLDFWSYGYIEVNPVIKRFMSIKTVLTWLSGQAYQKAAEKDSALQAVERLIAEKNEKTENQEALNSSELILTTAVSADIDNDDSNVNENDVSIKEPEKPKSRPRKTAAKTKTADKTENAENKTQIPLEINEQDLALINGLMENAKSTHELYIMTVKQFGQKKGMEIYAASKPQFTAMLKASKSNGISKNALQ